MLIDDANADARATNHLKRGEHEAALNVVSRYPVACDVAASVQIANEKFAEAALSSYEHGNNDTAVVCALLARPQRLAELSHLFDSPNLGDKVLQSLADYRAQGFVGLANSTMFAACIKAPVEVVSRVLTENLILSLCEHASSVSLSSLAQFCGPETDVESAILALVSEGLLNAALDDTNKVLVMLNSSQYDQATDVLESLLLQAKALSNKLRS